MKKKHLYSVPETEVFPIHFMEDVCQNLSGRGNAPDYTVDTYDPEWED